MQNTIDLTWESAEDGKCYEFECNDQPKNDCKEIEKEKAKVIPKAQQRAVRERIKSQKNNKLVQLKQKQKKRTANYE